MNKIKTITKGKYELSHCVVKDEMGLLRNSFELKVNEGDSTRIIPFFAPLRVTNLKKDEAYLGDDTTPYTDEKYDQMMEEQINKYEKLD